MLAITHALTNRSYGFVFDHLDAQVEQSQISCEDYATGVMRVEAKGVTNKIIVAAELGIAYGPVQALVDGYA